MKTEFLFSVIVVLGFAGFLELAQRHVGLIFLWSSLAWLWGAIGAIVIWYCKKKETSFVLNFLPLFFFFTSNIFLLLFLDRGFFRQILIIISSLLIFWYLIILSSEKNNQEDNRSYEATDMIILFTLFLIISTLFGWLTFLANQFWPILLLAIIFFWLFFLVSFKIQPGEKRSIILPAVIASFMSGELFWSFSLLPVGFLIKGLALSLLIIYLKFLLVWHLRKNWSIRRFLVHSLVFLVLIILILTSARWI